MSEYELRDGALVAAFRTIGKKSSPYAKHEAKTAVAKAIRVSTLPTPEHDEFRLICRQPDGRIYDACVSAGNLARHIEAKLTTTNHRILAIIAT